MGVGLLCTSCEYQCFKDRVAAYYRNRVIVLFLYDLLLFTTAVQEHVIFCGGSAVVYQQGTSYKWYFHTTSRH